MRNIERLSLRPLRRARRETIRHHLKLVRFLKGKISVDRVRLGL